MAHNTDDNKDNITSNTSSAFHHPSSTSIRPNPQNNAFSAKIAELFLTAGHAFQKLGDLTVKLNAVNVDHEENRWTEKDIENLRDAITRFANELDNVSGSLSTRSKKMIRTDIKRRTLQMGIEPGGTTLTGGRTVLKPVSQTDPYLQQSVLSLNPTTSKSSLATTSVPSSLSHIDQKPSTSGTQNQNSHDNSVTSNGSHISLGSSLPTSSHTVSTSLTSTSVQSKNPVLKKVIFPNSGTSLGPLRRQPGPIYRSQAPSGASSSVRLIPGQNAPTGRKMLVAGNHFVRVVTPQDTDRQRQLSSVPRNRFQLGNGYVNEEIVYTSPGPQERSIKRTLADPSPVNSKAPKLEAAES
ncbi:unnamed protein product [Bursaphelenchus okinawaensis]|uniref:Uncharacterized protein n=1 Tax=Bursaphelenchus okinawaensis TaxID=465554 RepID=A0A811LHD1_9BILA|nr:unnamed protein product [Bursaphelenchus okinawaensis]CAG9125363.1 unnamed protein product [Bursaphelenchus okinawaensis]